MNASSWAGARVCVWMIEKVVTYQQTFVDECRKRIMWYATCKSRLCSSRRVRPGLCLSVIHIACLIHLAKRRPLFTSSLTGRLTNLSSAPGNDQLHDITIDLHTQTYRRKYSKKYNPTQSPLNPKRHPYFRTCPKAFHRHCMRS